MPPELESAPSNPEGTDAPLKGGVLIEALRHRGVELGMSTAEIAEQLGLSYSYYSALITGRRPIPSIRSETFRAAAAFLRTSVVQVLIWAEAISLLDFHYADTLADSLDVSFAKMHRDPEWGAVVPPLPIWNETPVQSKLAIVLLYERLANKRLLERANAGPIVDSTQTPVSDRRVA